MEHDMNGLIDKKISMDAAQIKCVMHQVLEALVYLHSKGIMHRDIKGSNILLNNKGDVKLADFGLARKLDRRPNPQYTNRVITLWYRAPELLLGSRNYSTQVDMWSMGCFFFELLTFKPLFPGDKEARMLELIYQICGTPSEENWPGVTSMRYFKTLGPKKPMRRSLREELKNCSKYLNGLYIIK